MIFKSPRFVPFYANLDELNAKSEIPTLVRDLYPVPRRLSIICLPLTRWGNKLYKSAMLQDINAYPRISDSLIPWELKCHINKKGRKS